MLAFVSRVLRLVSAFSRGKDGAIAPIFALTLIPIMTAAGAALDYSRANNFKAVMQASIDTALLAGAKDGSSDWQTLAKNVFSANIASKAKVGTAGAPTFKQLTDNIYSGAVSGTVPTSVLGIIHIPFLVVSVKATATASAPDDSCILTLDHGQPSTHVSLSLNGAPVINLSGCSIRSNTALDCNGHDGSVTKAIAHGAAADCGHPSSYQMAVPDTYASLAQNITTQCGTNRPGVTWVPGSPPSGAGVRTVTNASGQTEYHICGNLSLSGSGSFAPGADTVIVIENGSLNIANNASVSLARTAVVLTGNNSYPSSINFPTGNGQSASLTLSPPLSVGNPWQGVALFQDPKLTNNVDNRWGPGATFNADGLVYLGNSNVVTDGVTSSSNAKCSKFVTNSFVTNGAVNLDFDQSVASCAVIGLKQWGGVIVQLKS